MSLERFLVSQQEWSQATFGTKEVRGPLGPLNHLKKEAKEAIEAGENVQETHIDPPLDDLDANVELEAANKKLLYELVDCFFLVMDAVWRAGFTQEQFENALWEKLKINKERKWPPLNEQDPTKAAEHDRS